MHLLFNCGCLCGSSHSLMGCLISLFSRAFQYMQTCMYLDILCMHAQTLGRSEEPSGSFNISVWWTTDSLGKGHSERAWPNLSLHTWLGFVKFVADIFSQAIPRGYPSSDLLSIFRSTAQLLASQVTLSQSGDTFSSAFSTCSLLTSQMDLKKC